jgi:triosephosphate isomerase
MKIIVANWKMNQSFKEVNEWLQIYLDAVSKKAEILENQRLVLCPPFHVIEYIDSELVSASLTYFEEEFKKQGKEISDISQEELHEMIISSRAISLGAQDCHYREEGAYTGDISAKMLSDIGCEFVIVGHSERRLYHGESDKMIAQKARVVINNGMLPVICIGESKESRQQGKHFEFIYNQLATSIPKDVDFAHLIIAYEPIWSVGTGVIPTTEQLQEVAKNIEDFVAKNLSGRFENLYILYGGSINSQNSKQLINTKGISGLLVGKASLDAEEFCKIASLK